MYDIFLSYSNQDRERLQPLFQCLKQQGWSVFWDHRTIEIGDQWGKKIDRAIRTCKCVVVVWSKTSVDSEWVVEEANIGKQREVLLPIRIDEVIFPVGFTMRQTGDFVHWDGDANDPQFARLAEKVRELVGQHDAGEAQRKAEVTAEQERLAQEKAAVEQQAREQAEQQRRLAEEARLRREAAEAAERERLAKEQKLAQQRAAEQKAREEAERQAKATADELMEPAEDLEDDNIAETLGQLTSERRKRRGRTRRPRGDQNRQPLPHPAGTESSQPPPVSESLEPVIIDLTGKSANASKEAARQANANQEPSAKKFPWIPALLVSAAALGGGGYVWQATHNPSVGASPAGDLSPATAPGHYTINGDGTVTDTKTGLMWKQCSEGQSGSSCSGDAAIYKLDGAMSKFGSKVSFAGYSDWRMPTDDELRTLVYCSNGTPQETARKKGCGDNYQRPTIDLKAFPNTPGYGYWSSTARDASYAWFVTFDGGDGSWGDHRHFGFHVRLVRSESGQ